MLKAFNIVAAALAVLLTIALFRAKTEADAARDRVEALEAAVAATREDVAALEAEAAHVTSPGEIERVAREKLGMRPAAAEAVITPEGLDRVAPVEEDGP